eukprot:gene3292-biopygen1047
MQRGVAAPTPGGVRATYSSFTAPFAPLLFGARRGAAGVGVRTPGSGGGGTGDGDGRAATLLRSQRLVTYAWGPIVAALGNTMHTLPLR